VKKVLAMFSLLVLVTSLANALVLQKGTEALNNVLAEYKENDQMLPIVIGLSEQYDTTQLYNEIKNLSRADRRIQTIDRLRDFSSNSQLNLRRELESLEKENLVKDLRFLWISNLIGLKASVESLQLLDTHPDIEIFHYDPPRKVLDTIRNKAVTTSENLSNFEDEREIPYNVSIVNAPEVWDLGYRGEGVIVGVIDSGVNYNHLDLINRMWVHPEYPYHGYDFANDLFDTMDNNGHGTHCAGTVAGDGTAGSETGVAPESTIMALKAFYDTGYTQEQFVWNAIQFGIENGVDVFSMSFGWVISWSSYNEAWRSVMENTLAAGVVAAVAAGNQGNQQSFFPAPDNIITPGNCPPPWLNPDQTEIGGVSAVISVGATTADDSIAGFSSVGPVTWQNFPAYNDYPHNPGMGLIRPDVVAAGDNVKSLSHNNNQGYTFMSGTSMATPAVAGAIALLLSMSPDLTPELISELLETSAVNPQTTKNNTYGAGRIDVLEALSMLPPSIPKNPDPYVGETNISTTPLLSWTGGMADEYSVFVGTDNPPTDLINGHTTISEFFNISEVLEPLTEYFWSVESVNSNGVTEGPVWSFITGLAVSEDFETGDFSQHDWQFSTAGSFAQQWEVTSEQAYNGQYSAQSGEINNFSTTSLIINIDVQEAGVVSFCRKVSTEEGGDYLRFYIDGTLIDQWSGEHDWSFVSYDIEAGNHTLRWTYFKNHTGNGGEDRVWIDDITFPVLVEPTPPILPPESVEYIVELDSVTIYWQEVARSGRDRNPREFLGYNVYRSLGDGNPFEVVNDDLITTNEFTDQLFASGQLSYYLTAVYDSGESEPSELVTFTIGDPVADPTFSPESGEYAPGLQVMIESEEDTVVHYTVDGTIPSTQSLLYEEPLIINETLTLMAKAYKQNHLPGDVVSAEYTIVSSTEENTDQTIPYLLVYPNPFVISSSSGTQQLSLTVNVPSADNATLLVYNLKGQLVRTIKLSRHELKSSTISWDLKNDKGIGVRSGVYLMRLLSHNTEIIKRVVVVR